MFQVHKYAIKRKNRKGRLEWFARIRWREADGAERSKEKKATSRTHAKTLADQLAGRFAVGGADAIGAEKMTFAELAEEYGKTKLIDAVYDGEIKVAGLRARAHAEQEVNTLLKFWSAARLQEIKHHHIEAYKIQRLQTPTRRGTPRKMSSVNHELRRLRTMLNFALRRGWIMINPFNQGDPLISEAAEIPRDRAEQPGELERLLAACHGRRGYMRPFILCLVETALRVSEARRLTRGDIDLDKMLITARASMTKTNRRRFVPISTRLAEELRPLLEAGAGADAPIFGSFESNKKAWRSICEDAGVRDLQLRDLRHWGATRIAGALAAANMPWQHGMAATGHTQVKTYLRYINKDELIAQQTGAALAQVHND